MKMAQHRKELLEGLRPGDIVIECGAHAGWTTEIAARSGATVYAFEPNPILFGILHNKFFNQPHVICQPSGVWHKAQQMRMYLYPPLQADPQAHGYASTIIDNHLLVDPNQSIQIEVIDLTVFIQSIHDRIKLLWLDIEGAEWELLEKIISMNLHTSIESVVVETHEWMIPGSMPLAERIQTLISERKISNIYLDSI